MRDGIAYVNVGFWKCWSPGRAAAMRIAQVAPLYEAVPPRLYGGTERIVAHLTDALVDLGHEVTLFASAEAQTQAKLVAGRDQAIRLDPARSQVRSRGAHVDAARGPSPTARVRHRPLPCRPDPFPLLRRARRADRDHTAWPAGPEGSAGASTRAGRSSRWSRSPTTSAGRCPMPTGARPSRTGSPTSLYSFTAEPKDGYLAFLGRISPEKRPDRAIEIARRSGMRLKIAAKVDASRPRLFSRGDRAAARRSA